MFDHKKLSDLKLGDVSGLALFIMGCIFFPFAMPCVAIIILWFSWLKHKDKKDKERWQQQREDARLARKSAMNERLK